MAVRRLRRDRRGKARRGGGRARRNRPPSSRRSAGAPGRSRRSPKPRPEPLPRRRSGGQCAAICPALSSISRRRGAPGRARRGGPVERDVPSRPRLFVHGDRQHAGGLDDVVRGPRHAPARARRLRGDGGGRPQEHRSPPRRRDEPPQLRRGPREARALRRGARGISPRTRGLRGRRDRLALGRHGRPECSGRSTFRRPTSRPETIRPKPACSTARPSASSSRSRRRQRFRRSEEQLAACPRAARGLPVRGRGDPRRRGYDARPIARRERA